MLNTHEPSSVVFGMPCPIRQQSTTDSSKFNFQVAWFIKLQLHGPALPNAKQS